MVQLRSGSVCSYAVRQCVANKETYERIELIDDGSSHIRIAMVTPERKLGRPCPYCKGEAGKIAFPYSTHFAGQAFEYRACKSCDLRYADPVPNPATLAAMYGSGDYQSEHYSGTGKGEYDATVAFLSGHLTPMARILDFGCGAGHLAAKLGAAGFAAEGGEFSPQAAAVAARQSGLRVHDLSNPTWTGAGPWDCIHFGDVIEHLGDPLETLDLAFGQVRANGLLSIEGPLEANASLVNAAIALIGRTKRWLAPRKVGTFAPYHLSFATAYAQRGLVGNLGLPLKELVWEVKETGWPYRHNGAARNAIALAAIGLAHMVPGWGNRFRVLYRKIG